MMKLSVIIPVYNAEKYLERCLSSVLASLEKADSSLGGSVGPSGKILEVLLVDNDSTDDSLAICKKLAKFHSKIISVLQCHTPGAAAAKNYGVARAKGEYIWFIDADDWIAKDAIMKLVERGDKTGADLVMMGAERVYPDKHRDYLSPVAPTEADYKSRFVRYGMGPWQVLIRRKWWLRHKFSFKEGYIHEDMELMSVLILYTDKFSSINEPLYYYSQNEDSVLHRREFSPHIFDIFPALEGLYGRFREAGADVKYHDELEWFFIWNLLIDSAKDFGQFPEGKSGFARSREMLMSYFPNWRKNRFLGQKPLKLRIRVRLNYKK